MFVKINEIYLSLSGEGITTGCPTILVRLAGCSLRCGITKDGRKLWCDTPYALSFQKGKELSVDETIYEIKKLQTKTKSQILITGGEPLEGINREFTQELSNRYKEICLNPSHPFPRIETNGAELLAGLENMVFTMDYKLPGSGMEERMNLENFEILKFRNNPLDEIKFVVRDKIDYERSIEVWEKFQPSCWVLYSPVYGELDPRDLAEWLKKSPIPKARLSLQIHKVLWGELRGV